MNKATFIYKMSFPLIGLGILLSLNAYIPVLKVALGFDDFISISFSVLITTLVGGYMAALAGFIIWARLIAAKPIKHQDDQAPNIRKPHLLGLSFLIPLPFISCLILAWCWKKERHLSRLLDETYRETINFHLTMHLYLLISFFLMPIIVGFVMIILILTTFFLATIFHCFRKPQDDTISHYPINIQIAVNSD